LGICLGVRIGFRLGGAQKLAEVRYFSLNKNTMYLIDRMAALYIGEIWIKVLTKMGDQRIDTS